MSLSFDEPKKKRRDQVEPQLAAMVDVFSILIIFLIAGTVMGTSSILIPEGVVPAKSYSRESLLSAPQLTVTGDKVLLSYGSQPYELSAFGTTERASNSELLRFKEEIRIFLKNNGDKPDSSLINFVTDRGTTYDKIFNVVQVAREAGVQAILFISIPRETK